MPSFFARHPRSLFALVVLGVSGGLFAVPASAAVQVMDFSPYGGLGFGVGTTSTLTQNGIRMQSLSGSYEITQNPNHELNLKDFAGNGTVRTVQFDMSSA